MRSFALSSGGVIFAKCLDYRSWQRHCATHELQESGRQQSVCSTCIEKTNSDPSLQRFCVTINPEPDDVRTPLAREPRKSLKLPESFNPDFELVPKGRPSDWQHFVSGTVVFKVRSCYVKLYVGETGRELSAFSACMQEELHRGVNAKKTYWANLSCIEYGVEMLGDNNLADFFVAYTVKCIFIKYRGSVGSSLCSLENIQSSICKAKRPHLSTLRCGLGLDGLGDRTGS